MTGSGRKWVIERAPARQRTHAVRASSGLAAPFPVLAAWIVGASGTAVSVSRGVIMVSGLLGLGLAVLGVRVLDKVTFD